MVRNCQSLFVPSFLQKIGRGSHGFRFYIVCALVFCLIQNSTATPVDSLYSVLGRTKSPASKGALYGQISFQLSSFLPDSAVSVARRGMYIGREIGNESIYAQCASSLGWAYYRLSRNDSAISYMLEAVRLYKKRNEVKDEGRGLINLSIVYDAEKKFEPALKALLRARSLLESSKDEMGKAYAEKMIGVIYRKQGYPKEAIQYLRCAYQSFRKQNNIKYSADVLSSIGSEYLQTNIDSAFWYYRQAILLINEDSRLTGISNKSGLAYAYENLGNVYMQILDKKNYALDSAYFYLASARDIFIELNAGQDIAYENMNIAKCLSYKKDYRGAEKALLAASSIFDSLKSINYAHEVNLALSDLYKLKGDYKKALFHTEKALVLNDSLNARNRNETIADLLTRYESEKKDRTIALLDAEKRLSAKELSRNRLVNTFAVIFILLLLLLILTLLNRYRIKRELQDFKLRDQLANDLHDDIGSSLSSILLLSKMADSKALVNINSGDIIYKISVNARAAMDKMSDIVWTTNPKFDEGSSLRDKMESHIQQIRNISGIEVIFSVSDELDNYRFPMQVRKNIFLIFKEAVTNILKHASASRIDISVSTADRILELAIQDNGCGFQNAEHGNGFGMGSMNTRAQAVGGTVRVSSASHGGTRVCLSLPVAKFRSARLIRKI